MRTRLGPTIAQQDRAIARLMDRALRRSVKNVALGMTLEELNLVRQWFNATDDCAPKYLEAADRRLMKKIMAALSAPTS